jgi:hypothetical protein
VPGIVYGPSKDGSESEAITVTAAVRDVERMIRQNGKSLENTLLQVGSVEYFAADL